MGAVSYEKVTAGASVDAALRECQNGSNSSQRLSVHDTESGVINKRTIDMVAGFVGTPETRSALSIVAYHRRRVSRESDHHSDLVVRLPNDLRLRLNFSQGCHISSEACIPVRMDCDTPVLWQRR